MVNWILVKQKVNCCACSTPLKNSKHINGVTLNKLATWEYPTWGNILVRHSHPEPRACAILCDECIQQKKKVKFAVEWNNNLENIIYHPVSELQDLPPITEDEVRYAETGMMGE